LEHWIIVFELSWRSVDDSVGAAKGTAGLSSFYLRGYFVLFHLYYFLFYYLNYKEIIKYY
tara:strand:- start:54 stop:233 length:180 start_codon:yes stop_codon:yes gene_type:complete